MAADPGLLDAPAGDVLRDSVPGGEFPESSILKVTAVPGFLGGGDRGEDCEEEEEVEVDEDFRDGSGPVIPVSTDDGTEVVLGLVGGFTSPDVR